MREALMMDDYPLSLTNVIRRAEQFSGHQKVAFRRPDGIRRPYDDGRVHRALQAARRRRCRSSGSATAIRSPPCCGTSPSTWSCTSRCRAWPRCSTRSTRVCIVTSSASSSTTPRTRRSSSTRRCCRVRGLPRRARVLRRDRRAPHRRRAARRLPGLRAADRRRRADAMAGRRRAPGGRDVLHVGHDRPAEGRRLLASLDGPALADRGAAGRQVRLATRRAAAGRADVPCQRVGDDLHRGADRHRVWCCPGPSSTRSACSTCSPTSG